MKSCSSPPWGLVLLAILVWLDGGLVGRLFAVEPSVLDLQTNALVDGAGISLNQVVRSSGPLPDVTLAPAPPVGRSVTLTRDQIQTLLQKLAPDFAPTNWLGADRVRVSRRARAFAEEDLKPLLTAALQREFVKDRGELELHFARPWAAVNLPDEPLNLRIFDMPASGVSPMFIVRIELATARESLGSWQIPVQARVWKEIWVAQSPLKRGSLLRDADLVRQRRDLLTVRDPLADVALDNASFELAEGLPAGAPLLARVVRLRALVHRGQSVEALVQDGALEVTMKVEVLEDGVSGQVVRARNPQSRREIRGKVLDEKTLLVTL